MACPARREKSEEDYWIYKQLLSLRDNPIFGLTLRGQVEALHQLDDAGLAAAAGPHQGHNLAWGHPQAQTRQHAQRGARWVVEVHVLEGKGSGEAKSTGEIRLALQLCWSRLSTWIAYKERSNALMGT